MSVVSRFAISMMPRKFSLYRHRGPVSENNFLTAFITVFKVNSMRNSFIYTLVYCNMIVESITSELGLKIANRTPRFEMESILETALIVPSRTKKPKVDNPVILPL
jgi:hypothetical protein